MAKYFILDCHDTGEGNRYRFRVLSPEVRDKRWVGGYFFSPEREQDDMQPPVEPILLEVKAEKQPPLRYYGEMFWVDIPLMSRRLVKALREAGVDNLQTYATKLTNLQEPNPPPEDHYLAVNIVGCIAAADLKKSQTNPEVSDKMMSMDFHSLAIDPTKTRNALMFRLAEDLSAVLVHERVRQYVESRGIDTLTWYNPEQWAG